MGNEPNSLKTMRRFYMNRLAVPTEEDIHAEMMGGNDRSAIVTVGALIDAALTVGIAERMPNLRKGTEADYDEAFGFNGPLGTFSAKIEVAFYLDAIDQTTREQLHDLRAMRNVCAHSRHRISFDHPELANVARRFFRTFPIHSETADGFKRTLVVEGMLLYHIAMMGRAAAIEHVRKSFTDGGDPSPI